MTVEAWELSLLIWYFCGLSGLSLRNIPSTSTGSSVVLKSSTQSFFCQYSLTKVLFVALTSLMTTGGMPCSVRLSGESLTKEATSD